MSASRRKDEAMTEQFDDSGSPHVVGRVGDTVVRHARPWTPAVHDLLRHLEKVNFPYSPRVLGLDPEGNEVLTYFDGVSGKAGWAPVVSTKGLRAFAHLLRSYHDAVAGYRPDGMSWAVTDEAVNDDEVICHGDFAPWNMVWRGDQPVGIIDWDMAGPHPPLYDIVYALEFTTPFRGDEECLRWLAYPEAPDRRRRMEIFAEAYGLASTAGLYEAVLEVQQQRMDNVRLLAERGDKRMIEWIAGGWLEQQQAQLQWSRDARGLFTPT